jgi:CRP-like cAMP-binding protein
LTWEEKDALIEGLYPTSFDAGSVIITEGETGTQFYIIAEGGVICRKGGI